MAEPRLVAVSRMRDTAFASFLVPLNIRQRWQAWFERNEARNPEVTYDVAIRVHRKRRSLKSNSKLHSVIGEIAEWTGKPAAELKLLVKFRAVMNRAYPVTEEAGVPWPKPSHLANSEEASKLIEEALDLAAFYEVPLRDFA